MLSRRWLLPTLVWLYAMNFMDRSVLGMVGEHMRLDLGFSDARMGLLHSALPLSLVALVVPCAVLNDLLGRRRMIALAAGLWSLAMLATGAAAGFAGLVCARLLGGVNEGFVASGGGSWLAATHPPEKLSRCLGLFYMASPLGMALGTLAGGMALSLTGSWRTAFFLFVLPGLLAALIVPALPDVQRPAASGFPAGIPAVLRKRSLIVTGCAAGFFCVIKFAYQAWMPTLLMRGYGLDGATAGALCALMLAAGVAGPYLGGWLADWWERRSPSGRMLAGAACMALMAAVKLVFYLAVGRVSLPVACGLGLVDGVVTMTPMPIYFSVCQVVVEERYRSTATGLMGLFVFLCGGAWGPWLAGALSDRFGGGAEGLRLAMLVLLVFALAAALLYILERDLYRRERDTVEKGAG